MTSDSAFMKRAIRRAEHARLLAPPNPWVGALLVTRDQKSYEGCTQRPGSDHAERQVIDNAGRFASGATLYTTLEPCCHSGRTPPCVDLIINSGIIRVVTAVEDPDINVAGKGIQTLRDSGVEVTVGTESELVEGQLAPYLKQRRTGHPYVVLKLAATLDGQIAASDGTSQWITGPDSRSDVQMLRAASDAILVGAGTVRADDPRLTVRGVSCSDGASPRDPLRVVLGSIPESAQVLPAISLNGSLESVLEDLGSRDVLQVLVEGGAKVAAAFHSEGLVDKYVIYLAPAFMGGSTGMSLFSGNSIGTISDLERHKIDKVEAGWQRYPYRAKQSP